jgi:hypothetical protein
MAIVILLPGPHAGPSPDPFSNSIRGTAYFIAR